MKHMSVAAVALALVAASTQSTPGRAALPLQLTSTRFTDGGAIPPEYTCEGQNSSPPLSWSDVPEGTQGFALVVSDPEAPDPSAPRRVFVHWVLYNLPAATRGLAEGIRAGTVPEGAAEGVNDDGKIGYTGPCPPVGKHHYHFDLYALDTTLQGLASPTRADLERAMVRHVVARAELVGTYQKAQKHK
jgi:Raf kinase inhibitor-like YbhB/YbcL family protein